MTSAQLELLQYPIGKFDFPENVSEEMRKDWFHNLKSLPSELRILTQDLSEKQLDTPYRPEGWTVRQVVHHLADSHSHAMIRIKWALTEDRPTIKAYHEDLYAELADSKKAPIEPSLVQIEGIHKKLLFLLSAIEDSDFERSVIHPETGAELSVLKLCGMYSWHGKHHCAHIAHLRKRKDW